MGIAGRGAVVRVWNRNRDDEEDGVIMQRTDNGGSRFQSSHPASNEISGEIHRQRRGIRMKLQDAGLETNSNGKATSSCSLAV